MTKTFVVATVLVAAALTGILFTSPIAFAQDESETNTEQEIKQKNVGSGDSINNNCGVNSIDATLAASDFTRAVPPNTGTVACPVGSPLRTLEELPSTPEIE
jgi:hypothetical protein